MLGCRAADVNAAVTDQEFEQLTSQAFQRLSTTQRILLAFFLLVVVLFAALTVVRSAYLTKRHTDADVYFRAAWAVSTHEDIYRATDDNGWHYHYPPLLATLLLPFADPPHFAAVTSRVIVPFPVAVTIWFAISVLAVALGVHILASAFECETLPAEDLIANRYSQAWWALRVLPVLVTLEPTAHSLGRGQATTLVFFFVSGMIAAWMQRKDAFAGICLATAICLKVFPAYLLLVPVLSCNWRFLAGCAAGLMGGLIIVPGLIAGFSYNFSMLQEFFEILSADLLGQRAGIRSAELFNEAFGDLMSFRSLTFKAVHLSSANRPTELLPLFTWLHIAISLVFTAIPLWLTKGFLLSKNASNSGLTMPLLFGVLITGSVPMVPTAQSHYFILSIILVMALIASIWQRTPGPEIPRDWQLLFAGVILLGAVREIPGLRVMTDLGAPVWSALLLYFAGICELRRAALSAGHR